MICARCEYRKPPKGRKTCLTCKSELYRQRNPIRASYQSHKDNAKRRGIPFELTFDQFKKFAVETRLVINSGKTAKSYSIDRIDNSKGYNLDNIQVLTISDNSKKYHADKKIQWVDGSGLRVVENFNYQHDPTDPF